MRRLIASLAVAAITAPALADDAPAPAQAAQPAWVQKLASDPDSPQMRSYAEQQRKRLAVEKDLKKLRFDHFRKRKDASLLEEGLGKLRGYTDPAVFPSLIELFGDEIAPVRAGLVKQFADLKNIDGDTCLMWLAVFNKHADTRAAAAEQVVARSKQAGSITDGGRLTVLHAIANSNETAATAASQLASTLGITEAIPLMINAQLGGAGGGGGGGNGEGTGDLAFIAIGTQHAYVSDLQPVVADSAVAFDPTLSVVTTGVVLRIGDASVTTYRDAIHTALVDFTSRESGQDTSALAYNVPAWNEWYTKELKPKLDAKAREQAAKVTAQQASDSKGQADTASGSKGAPK